MCFEKKFLESSFVLIVSLTYYRNVYCLAAGCGQVEAISTEPCFSESRVTDAMTRGQCSEFRF